MADIFRILSELRQFLDTPHYGFVVLVKGIRKTDRLKNE
jgi:hypothetical protein